MRQQFKLLTYALKNDMLTKNQEKIVCNVKVGFHNVFSFFVKVHISELATKFCEISTFLLSYVVPAKSKVEVLQNFVAFSE